jgi:hypothetical protein
MAHTLGTNGTRSSIQRLYELRDSTSMAACTRPSRTAMPALPQASPEVRHRVRGRRRDRARVLRDRRRRRAVRAGRDRRRLGEDEARRRSPALLPRGSASVCARRGTERRTSVRTTSVDVVPGSAGVGVHHSYVVGGTPEMLYSVAVSVSLAAPPGVSGAVRRGRRARTCSASQR